MNFIINILKTLLTTKLNKNKKLDNCINIMENNRFYLKHIHKDYTYSDDIKLIKHLLLLIPTNEYSKVYFQIIHLLD